MAVEVYRPEVDASGYVEHATAMLAAQIPERTARESPGRAELEERRMGLERQLRPAEQFRHCSDRLLQDLLGAIGEEVREKLWRLELERMEPFPQQ